MEWEEWDTAVSKYYEQTWDSNNGLSSLPAEWQREVVALWVLNNQVHNGGYLQFLGNFGRETHEYASRALRRIGAHNAAKLIDGGLALIEEHFPLAGKSYEDRNQLFPNPIIRRDGREIKAAGSVLPDSVLNRLSDLSWEIMDFPDDFMQLAVDYYAPLIERDGRG